MKVTLDLDDEALRRAKSAAPHLSTNDVVHEALRLFAQVRQQKRLLDLRGKVDWQGDIDELRARH